MWVLLQMMQLTADATGVFYALPILSTLENLKHQRMRNIKEIIARRSFVNIYADGTTVYDYTSKTSDDLRLAADHMPDPAHAAQSAKNCLLTFNATQTKLVTLHSR